jgi:hypothetical protein
MAVPKAIFGDGYASIAGLGLVNLSSGARQMVADHVSQPLLDLADIVG